MIKNYDKLFVFLQETLQLMQSSAPNVDREILEKIASFCYAIQSSETPLTQSLPDFPSDSLKYVAQIVGNNPDLSIFKAIYRLYPFNAFPSNESTNSINTLLKELDIHYSPQEKVVTCKVSKSDNDASQNECLGEFYFPFILLFRSP